MCRLMANNSENSSQTLDLTKATPSLKMQWFQVQKGVFRLVQRLLNWTVVVGDEADINGGVAGQRIADDNGEKK